MTDARTVAGFKGARGEILIALKKSQPVTTKELAAAFGVTSNGLRRYLKELEAEGLISYAREIRGVGGPTFAYRLTESGERLFPSSYDIVLSQALESVRSKYGTDAVLEIFKERWARIAEGARPELVQLPLLERARRLAELLSTMGYMAEIGLEGEVTLREHHCTIRALVEQFPEICAAEERFIQDVLGADVTRLAHIAKGANCCEYCITERAVRPSLAALGTPTANNARLQEIP